MRTNFCAHRRKSKSTERMEVIHAPYIRKDVVSSLTDHDVSNDDPAEEERYTYTEIVVQIRKETLRDAIAETFGLLEDKLISSVVQKSHNEISRTYNALEVKLQCLRDKDLENELSSVKFAGRLIHKPEYVTSSSRRMIKTTEILLDD